jgi:hypothetical protein
LARAAHARREKFGQERSHAGENSLGEKAERETEKQHHGVVEGNLRVGGDGHDRADRVQNEIRTPPDPIVEPGADATADDRPDDDLAVWARAEALQLPLNSLGDPTTLASRLDDELDANRSFASFVGLADAFARKRAD